MFGKDAANPVETGEVVERSDADAVPDRPVGEADAVDARTEAEEGELGDDLPRPRETAEGRHLKEVTPRTGDGATVAVEPHVPVAGRIDDFRMRKARVPHSTQNLVKTVETGVSPHPRRDGDGRGGGRHGLRRGGVRDPFDPAKRPEGHDPESGAGKKEKDGAQDGMPRPRGGARGRTTHRRAAPDDGGGLPPHIRSGAETPMRPSP